MHILSIGMFSNPDSELWDCGAMAMHSALHSAERGLCRRRPTDTNPWQSYRAMECENPIAAPKSTTVPEGILYTYIVFNLILTYA